MSAVLHMPAINTAPFMLKEKLGDPFTPAFTAVNGRPSPPSPHASTGPHGVTAWAAVPRDPISPPASHSITPAMANRDRSPDSPYKRKRSLSPEARPRGSSRETPPPCGPSPPVSYPEQRSALEPHQRTLPPLDRLQSDRRWAAEPAEYQEHHHHEPRPLDPPHHMPPSHMSDPNEYDEGATDPNRLNQDSDQKRSGRKRQFANRTKTGCGTCRKRKKKCDEAKPKCNNCVRGNFECAGYATKIPWSKDGASKAPPALQAKERVSSAEIPAHYARCGVCNQVHIPHCESVQKPYPDSNGSDGARIRPASVDDKERKPPSMPNSGTKTWTEAPRYKPEHPPPPPPPQRHNPRVYHHTPQSMSQATPSHPAIAAQPVQYVQPPPSVPVQVQERPPVHDHLATRPPPPPPIVMAPMAPMAAAPPAPSPSRYSHPPPPPRSEKDKMLSGEPFLPYTDQLADERALCAGAVFRFNSLSNAAVQIASSERERQFEYIIAARWIYHRPGERRVTGHLGGGIQVAIPFHCDYGYNISIGDNVVIGPGTQLLDSGRIAIGRNTKIGARVTIQTVKSPADTKGLKGTNGTEIAGEVYIGENVYIADNCHIEAGVRIGNNAIIRAGSVVVRDIPADCIAVGNPAEVRQVNWKD
ncbi:maltose O-acetyltransferas-like protein [Boeremia exigua]|uniref:maltose O-acetyltransferase-like protein n=1 Tax=Boeremia exigua TaxID=749465 RepID=UPI001E8CFCBA|nr:maltose O-acetyltransferase-like protein [Boeremia exigua]KAH6639503.1 maltose O-acetyltransferas-like protein [Boeremia exigua]